jgi:branched-chain amino acid transport system ATP-binding protein
MAPPPLLEVRDLVVGYGPVRVVHGVDLSVDAGAVVALIGPNGAGKTTVLGAIAGLIPRQGGRILLDGDDLPRSAEETVRRGVALVPQGRRVFPQMSVEENLLLGAYCRGGRWRDAEARFALVFDYFPVLGERRRQPAGKLSGGEQQQLVIARALLSEPRLMLIDELSLGLAPKMVQTLLGMVTRLNTEQGTSFLLVEQAATAALDIATSASLLRRGEVVHEGPAEALRGDVDRLRQAYLGHRSEPAEPVPGR